MPSPPDAAAAGVLRGSHLPGRHARSAAGRCAIAALAFAGAVRAAAAEEPERTRSVGSPREYPDKEEKRVEWFRKLHGTWPPSRTYPGGQLREETETPGWRRYMEDFEVEARNLEANGDRWGWERWLELAQMRMSRNYSARGWLHTRLDDDVHAEVLGAWQQALRESSRSGGLGDEGLIGFYVAGERQFWSSGNLDEALRRRLVDDVRSKIAAWARVSDPDKLQMTSLYGLRSYLNGSVLKPHVDVITTHVLSAVYCVEVRQEENAEPWYIGAEVDFSGKPAKVDLRGGELFLYESAKLPHGRPTTFVGERYTAMFMHFQPPDWDLENYDRVYALPPDFRAPPARGKGKAAGPLPPAEL